MAAAIFIAAIAPVLAQDVEPTEAQMRAAVQQWLRDVHAPWQDVAALCTGSPIQRRSLPPNICEKVCAPDTSNCAVPGDVRSFRKDTCQPPDPNGQSLCSFTAEYVRISPQVKETGPPRQGLFQATGDVWRFAPRPRQ